MLEGLIYISAPKPSLGESDIVDILEAARQKNIDVGITGMLLYSPTMFVQILEGKTNDLDEVMAKIEQDERHSHVAILSRDRIEGRAFSSWSMAFREIENGDVNKLSAEIGWDVARQKMQDVPINHSLALLITSINDVVNKS